MEKQSHKLNSPPQSDTLQGIKTSVANIYHIKAVSNSFFILPNPILASFRGLTQFTKFDQTKPLGYMKWIISTLIGIVTMILGHYYFESNRETIDPTFIVNNFAMQEILSKDLINIAPIRITKANGEKIAGSIYSETFYFFNQGNKAIKPENILEPLIITLLDTTSEIIDFKILRQSRSVAGVKLVADSSNKHNIRIDFRILERNDGFVGQIIYASTSSPGLQLKGAIEGAPQGFSTYYRGDRNWLNYIISFSIALLFITLFILLLAYIKNAAKALDEEKEIRPRSTLSSALVRPYDLIIRNPENFAEKTSIRFTYSKIMIFSFCLFLVVFIMSFFLINTLLKQWFDPGYVPTIDLPPTLL